MGTKMVPAYANIFMGELEKKLITIGKPHILIWKRFIDDIFYEPNLNAKMAIAKPHNLIHRTLLNCTNTQ